MKVRIHPLALQDLADAASFLARDDFAVAERFMDAFDGTVALLAYSPFIGNLYPFRQRELADMRRFFVKGFPRHLIFYRVHETQDILEVVHVLDGSRDILRIFRRFHA